mmetsp:Transcript_108627/g.242536  ORF Transcript_108627/g.242536 Transcript_108627/m.242536 type:complete len:307 (+) Transcript_108627:1534-2454(+)
MVSGRRCASISRGCAIAKDSRVTRSERLCNQRFSSLTEASASPAPVLGWTNSLSSSVVQRRIAYSKPLECFRVLTFVLKRLSSSSRMPDCPEFLWPAAREASTTRESCRAALGVGSSSMNQRSSKVLKTRLLSISESVDRRSRSRATSGTSGCSEWFKTKALRILEAWRRTKTEVSLIRPRTVCWKRRSTALAVRPAFSSRLRCKASAAASGAGATASVTGASRPTVRPRRSKLTWRTQEDSSRKRMSTVSSTALVVRMLGSVSTRSLKALMAVFRSVACEELACITTQSNAARRTSSSSLVRCWR